MYAGALYQLYEFQRALLAPFAEFADAAAKIYQQPLMSASGGAASSQISAGFDLAYRLVKSYDKPAFGIDKVTVGGSRPVEVAVRQHEELRKPFCKLLQFKRYTDDGGALLDMSLHPKVLVVAPLSGHHSTLLRDTVKTLLQDHKVYITDWVDARIVPVSDGPFHLDDYIAYVQDFIRLIGPDVHVISVCQPTVPVLAAVSLMASRGESVPRSLTMMGGPIDARRSPTAVNNLATQHDITWFENNVIHRVPNIHAGAGRAVYPGFLQHSGFVAMNPSRHVDSHYEYFVDLAKGHDESAEAHRRFYDEYNAVLDLPAEFYLDTIKTIFQDFSLMRGTWQVKGALVKPQDIKESSLLTVEGELDDISGAGQTRAAQDLCSGIPASRKEHFDVPGAGHYGIFSGRRWRELVYPTVRKFIADNNKTTAIRGRKSART